ncbi:hypothetical protein BDN71DRAFT_1433916 [Pleurotus eryngii]|uniref:Uncharacterized protein n=1 Tax=Pleurotus eryngii TaxID=5323 RepID=A0A9P5ZNR9_PLEER|nr:hypothetical protein BDN71DRAFT_1433916 [Pleurotus eryngii]
MGGVVALSGGVASNRHVGCVMASGGCWRVTTMGGTHHGHHGWGVWVGGDGIGGVGAHVDIWALYDVGGCWEVLDGVVITGGCEWTLMALEVLGSAHGHQWHWGMCTLALMMLEERWGHLGACTLLMTMWGHREAHINVGGCGRCMWTLGGVHVDNDNVGGVGGMLEAMGDAEVVVVVEGRAIVREEKEVGGGGRVQT